MKTQYDTATSPALKLTSVRQIGTGSAELRYEVASSGAMSK